MTRLKKLHLFCKGYCFFRLLSYQQKNKSKVDTNSFLIKLLIPKHQSFKLKIILGLALRVVAAIILLPTLYFKFTGHPESVKLFNKLGVEPWGRIGTGVIELIASILLLIPATVFIGAFVGFGLMSGAILSQLTIIGVVSKGMAGNCLCWRLQFGFVAL